jgi:hypothetical protein
MTTPQTSTALVPSNARDLRTVEDRFPEVGTATGETGEQLSDHSQQRVDEAVSALDAWFDTIRSEDGYGGPVSHWWQQSFMYTGPGLDWRYEGIIIGYLTLWKKTSDAVWLEKATRAGDDLLNGQDAHGHFHASGFEINPSTGGTPHEAACDLALLTLANTLKTKGDSKWVDYFHCARRNLENYYLRSLWDTESNSIRDSTSGETFVPNKAATAAEAMFLFAEITGESDWVEQYAMPTVNRITRYQVSGAGPTHGAIAQNSFGNRVVGKYFPLYIARCIPALIMAYNWSGSEKFLVSAIHAIEFIARWTNDDGSLPTVIYDNGRSSRFPAWYAPLGDILRASELLSGIGPSTDFRACANRLLEGQDASGGIRTGGGFAGQATGRCPRLPDIRDVLHVAGWCDKAFRYLARHASPTVKPVGQTASYSTDCTFRGATYRMRETPEILEFTNNSKTRYRWRKGAGAPDIATEEFWLR